MYYKICPIKIKNGIEIAKIHLLKTANILENLLNKLNGGIKNEGITKKGIGKNREDHRSIFRTS